MGAINKAARKLKKAEKARLKYIKCINTKGEDAKKCIRKLSKLTKKEQDLIQAQTALSVKRGYFTAEEVAATGVHEMRAIPEGPISVADMSQIAASIPDEEIDVYPEEESSMGVYVASGVALVTFGTIGYFAWKRATGRE